MDKIVSTTKKVNAIFFATLLVIGTFTLMSQSFSIDQVQAQSNLKMTNDRNQVSVNSLKCNNINVNVNGLELDVLPQFLADSSLAVEAAESNTDTSSFSAGNGYGSEINDFRFICINNNNNTVAGVGEPVPPEPETCEECFTENIIDELQLTNFTGTLVVYTEFGDLEGLCEFLSDPTFTNNEKIAQLSLIFNRTNIPTDVRLSILECLDERGIIVFPPDSRL